MRARSGLTLLEILVVLAIMGGLTAVAVPSMNALFDLEQRGAARDLAATYKFLVQEAAMRNVTFRIAYNLDDNTYTIEVGDPDTLVFSNPEARARFEEEREDQLKMFTKDAREEAEAEDERKTRFAGLSMPGMEGKVALPGNSAWGFVYTPQYTEPQVWEEKKNEDDPPKIVYSYVFANGEAEYTVVRIVSIDDPEDGYSIEVEPVSGNVRVEGDLIEIGQSLSWLPSEAPTIR